MIAITASEQKSVTEKAKLKKKQRVLPMNFDEPEMALKKKLHILSRIDSEYRSFPPVIHGRNGPCNTYSKEDIHSIAASYISHASVCVFILYCGHFASKCIWKLEVEWVDYEFSWGWNRRHEQQVLSHTWNTGS